MKSYYKRGSWSAICDVCGFEYKAEELRKRWDGFMVCNLDFEFRNPQDFIKIPRENAPLPWTRPDSGGPISYGGCDLYNSVGIAGVGVAGCARTGRANIWG